MISNKCPSSTVKFVELNLSCTSIKAYLLTESSTDFNHTLVLWLFIYRMFVFFQEKHINYPSLWNSSASPAEISCSSAVMRATISSTASGA